MDPNWGPLGAQRVRMAVCFSSAEQQLPADAGLVGYPLNPKTSQIFINRVGSFQYPGGSFQYPGGGFSWVSELHNRPVLGLFGVCLGAVLGLFWAFWGAVLGAFCGFKSPLKAPLKPLQSSLQYKLSEPPVLAFERTTSCQNMRALMPQMLMY